MPKFKAPGISFKWYFFFILGGGLFFATAMMAIRIRITELGYEFEDAKVLERSLREEQVRLQAEISRRLSQSQFKKEWKALGYGEPEPRQVIVIP